MTEIRQTRLADDKDMPAIGSVIDGRYTVKRVLGEGGFATVYACEDKRTKTVVAVKVLDPMMSRRGEFSARFLREIETVSKLRHHNTIKIFDAGETDKGCLYLVMELLRGQALDEILETEGALTPQRVKTITIQVLKSLLEAHDHTIIHRDLKPANVFIADLAGETDYVKVLDFGIAKSRDESADTSLTATGQVMCSPDYVAPERVRDHNCFFASDLYSLGIMMIEMLEGELPYKGESPIMVALQHAQINEPVPLKPFTAHGPLGAVIAKAVSKNVANRYQSAEEMLQDLLATDCTGVPAYAPGVSIDYAAAPTAFMEGGGATLAGMAAPVQSAGGDTVAVSSPNTDALVVEKSNTLLYAIIAIAAVVLIGVLALFFLRERGEAIVDDGPIADASGVELAELPVAPALEEVPAPAVEPVREVPAPRYMTINTIPQGARVYVGDTALGVSPFALSSESFETYPVELRLELDEHEPLIYVIDTPQDVGKPLPAFELKEIPKPTRSTDRRTSSSRRSDEAPSTATAQPAASTAPSSAPATSKPADEPAPPARGRVGSIDIRR